MYHQMAMDDQLFGEYLDAWVYGVRTWEDYLEKVGIDRILEIKADPTLGYAPGLARK
jgi:glutaconate CoA-transferase subunit A